jgi:hypothetical protein
MRRDPLARLLCTASVSERNPEPKFRSLTLAVQKRSAPGYEMLGTAD